VCECVCACVRVRTCVLGCMGSVRSSSMRVEVCGSLLLKGCACGELGGGDREGRGGVVCCMLYVGVRERAHM
jgi:hypothetical protein